MKRSVVLMTSAAAVVLVMTLLAFAFQQPAVKRTVLQQGDLAAPGREGIMASAEFPVGGSTGRHTHPGDEMSYVREGTIRIETEGQPVKNLKAGDTFMIPASRVHNATNTGTNTAIVIATYIIEKGKPLATPVP